MSPEQEFRQGWYIDTPGTEKGPEGPLCEFVVGEATQRAPGEQSPGVPSIFSLPPSQSCLLQQAV